MNCLIHVNYKNHDYNFEITDYAGTKLANGSIQDKAVNDVIKSFSNKNINNPKWFIDKANETYVYDINNKSLELGDWACSFIIEGGFLEDWTSCYNL